MIFDDPQLRTTTKGQIAESVSEADTMAHRTIKMPLQQLLKSIERSGAIDCSSKIANVKCKSCHFVKIVLTHKKLFRWCHQHCVCVARHDENGIDRGATVWLFCKKHERKLNMSRADVPFLYPEGSFEYEKIEDALEKREIFEAEYQPNENKVRKEYSKCDVCHQFHDENNACNL